MLDDTAKAFIKKPEVVVIMHQKKRFNSIFTDGKSELEIDMKVGKVVNPLGKARKEIVSYFADNKSVNEGKKYDIGSGYMGNGLTIWNMAQEVRGDYKIIAHISDDGKLTIRDKQLPADLKNMFQIWADSMKKGNKVPTY